MTTFSEVVDAADNLSADEQETLLEILRRRIANETETRWSKTLLRPARSFNPVRLAHRRLAMSWMRCAVSREVIRSRAFIRAARRYLKICRSP